MSTLQPGSDEWDPGGSRLQEVTNQRIYDVVVAATSDDDDVAADSTIDSRTELDSHANMPVVGRHAMVLSESGKTISVKPYTPDYPPMELPLVDAAVQYDSPYDGKTYVLIVRDALRVPSMKNNLMPPFMMREAGIEVRDTPKIQVADPTQDDHAIVFPSTGFRIPLSLWGIFSYFPTSKPTKSTVLNCEDVYILSPTTWNPNSDAYAKNEESTIDWEGNVKPKKEWTSHIALEDVEDDMVLAATMVVSSVENKMLDDKFSCKCAYHQHTTNANVSDHGEMINGMMSGITAALDTAMLSDILEERANDGRSMMQLGSMNSDSGKILDQHHYDDTDEVASMMFSDDDEDDLEWEMNEEELDGIMISATCAAMAKGRKKGVTPTELSKMWRISLNDAKRTLQVTTQNVQRGEDNILARNYGTGDRMLRYKRIDSYFFMDTFFAKKKGGKSTRGHTCCQLFVTDKGFIHVVPMRRKGEVLQAVKQFVKEIGAPDALIVDMSGEQMSQDLKTFCNDIGSTLRALERGTQWSNKAELFIGIMKEAVRKDMRESDSPMVLWDYCIERRARINNLTAKDSFKLHGGNAHTATTGEEGDISSLCMYKWYDWCYFREQSASFPFNKEVLGRVLGPARGEGNEMSQWVLKANGRVVPRRSLRPLQTAEMYNPTEERKRTVFDECIRRKLGSSISLPPKPLPDDYEKYEDDDEAEMVTPNIEDAVDNAGKLINQQPAYDTLINAEVQLQVDGELKAAKVIQRTIDPSGNIIGTYDENPALNSIVYDVEFPGGQVKEYSANIIAENMYSQVDSEGFSTTLMKAIVDHRKDNAVAISKADMFVITKSGARRQRKTTKGWDLLIQWKDDSESWVKLADMKESHPIETAEFAVARGIEDEPAFRWWVPYTLRKRDVILSAVKSRIRKTRLKYGIEIPTTIEEAFELDRRNGNSFWRDALKKEMYNVGVAFEILDEGTAAPSGWHKVTGHIIWDVKMDFTRKARWVLDGHKTADPVGSKYAGVVSRDSVRIAFTYAALNNLDVCAADIRNAYLQAPSSRKDYIVCGPEFGLENVGRVALVHRALYGGKTAGRDFRNHLRSCMHFLRFKSCPADPDVWMRPAIKSDGNEYYEYVLLYTDDTIVVSENAEAVLRDSIGRYFELKKESIGPPKIYLGGHMRKVELTNGVQAWGFSSSQYVQAAVKNVETYLSTEEQQNIQWRLPGKAETPMQTSYRPELDVSPLLPPLQATYYQSLIGVLRWIVELGRVDICLEVSMMSSYLVSPREGHIQQLFHIFAYLKKYHNSEMVFDPTEPVTDMSKFERRDWASTEFGHLEEKEEMPPNMPQSRGTGFVVWAKIDADHAADTVTRRSRTGMLVYVNSALIYWSSKKQHSVESSSFGSEFVAMKQCCEYVRGLRYKLRMMGIPVVGPALIYGDNQSVLANATNPDSTLKKKSQSIAYHFVREGTARDEWRTAYVNTNDNEADLLTKQLPSGEKRKGFVRNILHHIFRT